MCEARVVIDKNGNKEEFMESVARIEPKGDKLILVDLFGEQKILNARLKEINLLDHEVVLEEEKPKEGDSDSEIKLA